jgi:hypothetical protein
VASLTPLWENACRSTTTTFRDNPNTGCFQAITQLDNRSIIYARNLHVNGSFFFIHEIVRSFDHKIIIIRVVNTHVIIRFRIVAACLDVVVLEFAAFERFNHADSGSFDQTSDSHLFGATHRFSLPKTGQVSAGFTIATL